jgi:hypothetical protein
VHRNISGNVKRFNFVLCVIGHLGIMLTIIIHHIMIYMHSAAVLEKSIFSLCKPTAVIDQ